MAATSTSRSFPRIAGIQPGFRLTLRLAGMTVKGFLSISDVEAAARYLRRRHDGTAILFKEGLMTVSPQEGHKTSRSASRELYSRVKLLPPVAADLPRWNHHQPRRSGLVSECDSGDSRPGPASSRLVLHLA